MAETTTMVPTPRIYRWGPGTVTRLDAQTVGEELEKLREEHNGAITAEAILEAARDPASPLHDGFTWDDSLAAYKHRLNEAGYLTRKLLVVFHKPDGEHTVRAYQNVTIRGEASASTERQGGFHHFTLAVPAEDDSTEDTRRVYVHIEDAMRDEILRAQVLERALNEIRSWQRRYAEYAELADIFASIERVKIERV